MDPKLVELYEDFAAELRSLYQILEQNQQMLSSCFGGEVQKASQQSSELYHQQLDGIKKDLMHIQYDI